MVFGVQVLDPALTRPGRLSRRVVVPLPDETGRADILAVHLRNTPMLSEADKEFCTRQIARVSSKLQQALTVGCSACVCTQSRFILSFDHDSLFLPCFPHTQLII